MMNKNTPQQNAEAKAKIITLFGGTSLTVVHEDQSTETIRVRQLRMFEYEKGMPMVLDEIALTAYCCSLDATPEVPCSKEWIMTLHPKSYEDVRAKVQEVNAQGFFPYADRKQQIEMKANEQWIRMAAELPPEVLENVAKIGTSALRTSLPRPR
jgi:hypothetical protein